MKSFLIFFILFVFVRCNTENESQSLQKSNSSYYETVKNQSNSKNAIKNSRDKEIFENKDGFLHVDLGAIYYNGKSLVILNKLGDTTFYFKNKHVFINGKSYEIINDEYLYKNSLKADHYDAEYGLFIMKAEDLKNEFYKVKLNGSDYFIEKKYNDILDFKTPEQHVLSGAPYLYNRPQNPLRKAPNDSTEIIKDYMKYTYVPIEIKGDWLKVKDDKECVPGEGPSYKDIIGWVRWRKNGKIIIDVRFGC